MEMTRKMLRVALWVPLLTLAAVLPSHGQSTAAAPDRVVELLTGTEKTLSVEYAIGNTAIGNPGVCEIEVLPGRREVLLIARGIGVTTLTIWDQRSRKREEIRIDVASRELSQLQKDLTALLAPYPGVRAEPLGSNVVLSGTVTTQEALAAVQQIAKAAGVASVVTLGTSLPYGDGIRPPGTVAGAPPAGRRAAPVPTVPVPTPPTPSLPADAALPVALSSADREAPDEAEPDRPVALPAGELADDGGPPPAAAVNPPPPNVFYVASDGGAGSLGFGSGLISDEPAGGGGSRPATTPSVVPPPGAGGAGGRVEYRLELYEQSALAPPPEVMGPQGTRIFGTTLTAYQGRPARKLLVTGPGGTPARGVTGIRVEVSPTIVGDRIATTMVVDTNLPIGLRDSPGPHPWRRARLQFETPAGGTRYVTESELAALMQGAGGAGPGVGGAGGPGLDETIATVGQAAGQVGSAMGMPGAQSVPAIGGLFRLGGGGGRKGQKKEERAADEKRLVIVVRAVLGAAR